MKLYAGRVTEEYLKWMNDTKVTKYTQTDGEYTAEMLWDYVESHPRLKAIYVFGEHVGNIKVGKKGDVGLIIAKKHWGKGYGTEAIKMVSKEGNWALINERNVASIRVFEKAGYTKINVYEYAQTGQVYMRRGNETPTNEKDS